MNRIPGRTCAVIASALLLAACAPPVPLAPSAPTTPPQGAPPLVPSTYPSEPTSTSAPIDLSSLEDEANSLRPTQPPPVPTPTPIFEWPEDIPYGDIPAALEYIHGRFGPPDEILYRYPGFGHGMDYGADFSDRISFETRLVYQDLGADFQLRSNPQVQLTGSHTGVARLCLAYTTEEDPNIWYDTSLWDVESRVPQKRLLFQDLAEAAHTSLSSLWDRFRTPFNCTNVPITSPSSPFFPRPSQS